MRFSMGRFNFLLSQSRQSIKLISRSYNCTWYAEWPCELCGSCEMMCWDKKSNDKWEWKKINQFENCQMKLSNWELHRDGVSTDAISLKHRHNRIHSRGKHWHVKYVNEKWNIIMSSDKYESNQKCIDAATVN